MAIYSINTSELRDRSAALRTITDEEASKLALPQLSRFNPEVTLCALLEVDGAEFGYKGGIHIPFFNGGSILVAPTRMSQNRTGRGTPEVILDRDQFKIVGEAIFGQLFKGMASPAVSGESATKVTHHFYAPTFYRGDLR